MTPQYFVVLTTLIVYGGIFIVVGGAYVLAGCSRLTSSQIFFRFVSCFILAFCAYGSVLGLLFGVIPSPTVSGRTWILRAVSPGSFWIGLCTYATCTCGITLRLYRDIRYRLERKGGSDKKFIEDQQRKEFISGSDCRHATKGDKTIQYFPTINGFRIIQTRGIENPLKDYQLDVEGKADVADYIEDHPDFDLLDFLPEER